MPSLSRSALLPYARGAVYDVVADIERYPEFLPWCTAAQVLSRAGNRVTAELEFAASGLRNTVTTQNTLQPDAMRLELISGPFSQFCGLWTFTELGAQAEACKAEFVVDYQLAGALALLAGRLVDRAADRLVDAFAARCDDVLGGAISGS